MNFRLNASKELFRINEELQNDILVFKKMPEFKGQSWGGAGAMVISSDHETHSKYTHRIGRDEILFTTFAHEIGQLYKIVRNNVHPHINFANKHDFWGRITSKGANIIIDNPSVSLKDLVRVIIFEAISFLEECKDIN